jgi:8-oxo-dGTP pyrophosphatase MutT (NUDIX family)
MLPWEMCYTITLALFPKRAYEPMLADREALVRTQNEPEQKQPPLDALIIPKATHECKQCLTFLQDPPMYFCLSHCIIATQGGLCYNKAMNLRNSAEVIVALQQRLVPVERADTLVDVLEGQYPLARKASVLLGLFDQKDETHLVFIRRATTLRAHSGEIAFPGGAVDADDTSPVITALREAHEEIGLDPARVNVLGILPAVFTVVSNFLITPVVAFLPRGLGPLRLQASEVTELILVPLHGLADPAIAHTEQWLRTGMTHTVYFFDYGPYRIWGATARIVSTLLELFKQ